MITYDALQILTSQILRGLGYPEKAADLTARVLVEADARGVASHGVARLAFYESNLKGGVVDLEATPEIVHETPLSLVVDGHGAVGPPSSPASPWTDASKKPGRWERASPRYATPTTTAWPGSGPKRLPPRE